MAERWSALQSEPCARRDSNPTRQFAATPILFLIIAIFLTSTCLPACLPVLQLLLPILGADLPHLRARSVGESSPMSTRRVPIDFSSGQNSEKESDSEVDA